MTSGGGFWTGASFRTTVWLRRRRQGKVRSDSRRSGTDARRRIVAERIFEDQIDPPTSRERQGLGMQGPNRSREPGQEGGRVDLGNPSGAHTNAAPLLPEADRARCQTDCREDGADVAPPAREETDAA